MVNGALKIKALREVKTNFKQYLAVVLIAALAVTLFTGIWANYRGFQDKLSYIYVKSSMCDGIITMERADSDVENFLKEKDVSYQTRIFMTAKADGKSVYVATFSKSDTMNKPFGENGEIDENGIYCDENFVKKHPVSEEFDISFTLGGEEKTAKAKISHTISHPESLGNSTYNPSFLYVGEKALVNFLCQIYDKISPAFIESMLPSFKNQYLIQSDKAAEIIAEAKDKFQDKDGFVYALERKKLPTNVTIEADVIQAEKLLYIFPVIFYLVAALIIVTSVSQLINREQKNIGILKSLGYTDGEVFLHYTEIFVILGFIGAAVGTILGPLIIPRVMGVKYGILYQLPDIRIKFFRVEYLLSAALIIIISFLSATAACLGSVKLAPARSLRGENSVNMKLSPLTHTKLSQKLPLSVKMAVRNMRRKVSRTVMVIVGVAGCSALLLCGFGIEDTINYGLDLEFEKYIPYDVTVTYSDYSSHKDELLSAVGAVEADEYAKYTVTAQGKNVLSTYIYVFPTDCKVAKLPLDDDSLILTTKLAKDLGVSVGDKVSFSINGATYSDKVTAITDLCITQGVIFTSGHFAGLNLSPTGAYIKTESPEKADILSGEYSKYDGISSAMSMSEMRNHADSTVSTIRVMTLTIRVFAILLAIVVLYNLALLNFKERAKDIATLKVLGFSAFETAVSFVIEIITLTVFGSLIGLFFGYPLLYAVLSINETPLISYIYHIYARSFIYTVLLTGVTSLAINSLFGLLTNKVKMTESLKSVE